MLLRLQFVLSSAGVEAHLAELDRIVADTFQCLAQCRQSAALARESNAQYRLQIERTSKLLCKERLVYR